MMLLRRLASVVRWIISRKRAEADLNDELQTFIDMAAADHIRDGASPGEAHRRAVLELEGLEQAKERVRSGRHGAWLDGAARDVRHGLRQIRRNPVFSAIAIATLGLVVAGGLMYTLGGVVSAPKRPTPRPEWFGFHEVFHTFTILAFIANDVAVSLATYARR